MMIPSQTSNVFFGNWYSFLLELVRAQFVHTSTLAWPKMLDLRRFDPHPSCLLDPVKPPLLFAP